MIASTVFDAFDGGRSTACKRGWAGWAGWADLTVIFIFIKDENHPYMTIYSVKIILNKVI